MCNLLPRGAGLCSKARGGRSQAERSHRLGRLGAGAGTTTRGNGGTNRGVGDEEDDGGSCSCPQLCTQQIDNLLMGYTIEECAGTGKRSAGSSAEDVVVVHAISLIM